LYYDARIHERQVYPGERLASLDSSNAWVGTEYVENLLLHWLATWRWNRRIEWAVVSNCVSVVEVLASVYVSSTAQWTVTTHHLAVYYTQLM